MKIVRSLVMSVQPTWSGVVTLAAWAVPLAIYTASLSPTVGFWDTGEMQTVPYIFGIAHPTGFPAFIMLGYLFSHLFSLGNVAWRLSYMSAIAMAGASWFAYRSMKDEGVHPALACISSWSFAFGYVSWTRATRAEVHALVLFFVAGAIWAALRARATNLNRFFYACGLSLGFAAATHPVMIWTLPGFMLLVGPALWKRPWKTAAITGVLALAPLLLYLYMPIRSAMVSAQHLDPSLAVGFPPGQPFWDFGHTANLHNFILEITGARFPKGDALRAVTQLNEYALFGSTFLSKVLAEFGIIPASLALVGLCSLFLRDRVKTLAFALIVLLGVPFALSYAIEVDSDRYLLTSYLALTVLVGIGAQSVARKTSSPQVTRPVFFLVTLLLLGGVYYEIQQSSAIFNQRHDASAAEFVDRIKAQTPKNSIIEAPWVFATPLAYAAYVERRLDDRIIGSAEPKDIAHRLLLLSRVRPVFVIFFETGPQSMPHARLVRVGTAKPPLLYRVVPTTSAK